MSMMHAHFMHSVLANTAVLAVKAKHCSTCSKPAACCPVKHVIRHAAFVARLDHTIYILIFVAVHQVRDFVPDIRHQLKLSKVSTLRERMDYGSVSPQCVRTSLAVLHKLVRLGACKSAPSHTVATVDDIVLSATARGPLSPTRRAHQKYNCATVPKETQSQQERKRKG